VGTRGAWLLPGGWVQTLCPCGAWAPAFGFDTPSAQVALGLYFWVDTSQRTSGAWAPAFGWTLPSAHVARGALVLPLSWGQVVLGAWLRT